MATLDPSVFYRDFAADSPITSGAQHLSAAATRLAFSIVYSITELPDAIWQQFKELLTPDTLWGLALVVAAWLIATIIGGPIGAAINGLLAAYGLYELWPVVKAVVGDLWAWLRTAYYADSEDELHASGKHFADALAKGGITTLEAIVTHRVFHGAAKKIRERFPTPEWLRKSYAEQETKRSSRKVDEEAKRRRRTIEETLSSAATSVLVPAGHGAGDAIGGIVVGGVVVAAMLAVVVGAAAMSPKGGR
ncbi:MAG TPA: hypothetical protein PK472_16280 [Pseudomonadota bacterium]|jgi:hypothetical protein|uniref:hypothetical protein n=1 Tax=Haliangium sp. UPWRP_2 TaxID=1931276 RepID=UPI000B53C53F|nr:hypothetical protein [Haliangium sp. UPWRP_2]PSM31633.1 hypothetical protein BVG81_004355 [Haliangium sp. UPWRP_2]HMY59823.1 hypothetical protein [Pseudomonadota bacterium]